MILFFAFAMPLSAATEQEQPLFQPHRQNYGPWNRNLDLYLSKDGKNFEEHGIFVERGGVPNLAVAKDGRILFVFQWFPLDQPESFDKIALMTKQEGKSWTKPQTLSIVGMPKEIHRSFDPALVVLPDRRSRLYFASQRSPNQGNRANRAIFSAISEDGLHYRFEPSQRFGLKNTETYDPAVVWFEGKWHLFAPAPEKGTAYHAASEDGLLFTRLGDIRLPGSETWIGNVIVVADEMHFYGSGQNVWSAKSRDGNHWQLDPSIQLKGGDPAVLQMPNGEFMAVTTGKLRSDASPGSVPV